MSKLCLKCNTVIPCYFEVNGKQHNLQRRKYCLSCSPFGERNTSKLHLLGNKQKCHSRDYTKMSSTEKVAFHKKLYKYQKLQRDKRKIELVLVKGGKCKLCGYSKNLRALQFHHRDPATKLFELNTRIFYTKSMTSLKTEANKCDLLCANCHAEQHNPESNNWYVGPTGFEPVTKVL